MALQSGELDAAYGLPYSNLILFRDEPYTISSADTSRTFFGQFNGSSEVLQDDRVREAVIGACLLYTSGARDAAADGCTESGVCG